MSKKGDSELIHQKEELDILEAIYMDELELHNALPPYKFSIQCRPYLDFHFDEILEKFAVRLDVELTRQYPQESPKCEIKHHIDKITNTDMQFINKLVETTSKEMKGSPMLFEIVETIRNWLQTSVVDPELRPKKVKKNTDDGDDDEEEGEPVVNLTKKETYTPVTRDSFLDWKAKFDAELEKIKRARGDIGKEKEEKLSGKQLFERDMNLMMSDMLGGEDDDVEETIFERQRDDEEDDEEDKEDDDAAEEERGKKLFCYEEDLFEGDIDVDEDDDA